MKRFLLMALVIGISITGFSQTEKLSFSSAIEYNDYLVDRINMVDKAYVEALEVGTSKEQSFKRIDILTQISLQSLKELKQVTPFNGEKTFLKSATDFVSYMNKISKKNLYAFEKLVYSEQLTGGKQKKMMSMANKLDADYDKYFTRIETAQKSFSENSGFTMGQ